MTEVLFYHLERATLESVLPGLLEKTLERGWKAVVRCGTAATLARLDDHLWTYDDESFLPHSADPARAADQPVLLTTEEGAPNGADVLFLVDGAVTQAINGFVRCVVIFDGGDDNALAAARTLWRDFKATGFEATYWKQSPQGRFEKQG